MTLAFRGILKVPGEAAQMLNNADSDPMRELLLAFAPFECGSLGHRRAYYLGLAPIRRSLARWGLPKIGPAREITQSLHLTEATLLGSLILTPQQIFHSCHLDSGFIDSAICSGSEFYAMAIYRAVAALNRFALYAGLPDGVDALEWASLADGEEYERLPTEMPQVQWLFKIALPAAYELRPLTDDELNPGWTRR